MSTFFLLSSFGSFHPSIRPSTSPGKLELTGPLETLRYILFGV